MNPFLLAALEAVAEEELGEALEEKRAPVASSFIAVVGYNPKTSTLTVEFKSGKSYEYSNVPYSVYQGFISAGSKGRYFRSMVKGVY